MTAAPDPERLRTARHQINRLTEVIVGEDIPADDTEAELPGLAGRLMTHAGDLPGKYDPPVSLSTHIINTVVTGVTAYVYDRVVRHDGDIDLDEARLLTAALALHDANKYVGGAYDVPFDTTENTDEVLDYYFEAGDDFGIRSVLPGETADELELDIADVKWLVQRTETKDSTAGTRGDASRRVRGLERYCRIGDGFVSKVHADGLIDSLDWLDGMLTDDTDTPTGVHHISVNKLEQPILNNRLIAAVRDTIHGEAVAGDNGTTTDDESSVTTEPYGIVLGSTPEAVAYFGREIDDETLRQQLRPRFENEVTQADFSAKTEWSSFEYDILDQIDIPHEAKRGIIADGYAATLRNGSGTDHEFESVPDGFRDYLPELVQVVFKEKNCPADLEPYPALHDLWEQLSEGDTYNNQTIKIGFVAETLRRFTGSVDDGYDPEQIESELAELRDDTSEALRTALQPESGGMSTIIDRFLGGPLTAELEVPSADSTCFLCGRPAPGDNHAYTKGNSGFYGGRKFSRRVGPEAKTKQICSVCDLEHALLNDLISDTYDSTGENKKIAFVYYGDFVADLSLEGSDSPRGLIRALQGDTDDDGDDGGDTARATIADPQLVASSFGRQYHLQPLYIDGENRRLQAVNSLLKRLVQRGFKITLGKPFSSFRSTDPLFSDHAPQRLQVAYGADQIESYDELNRVCRLFDILSALDGDGKDIELNELRQAEFEQIASLVGKVSDANYTVWDRTHDHFKTTPKHREKYMLMRDVAQAGIDFYGYESGSRHAKTKLFRKVIDATLDGLNHGKEGEQLVEHVAGQAYKTARADAEQSHFAQPENAKAFVEAVYDYIEQTDSGLDKSALSQRRDILASTYLFAYDQLRKEGRDSGDGDDAGDSENQQAVEGDTQ